MSTELPYSLERKIVICASRETVFRFFTDSRRFARWWGEGSTIEGRTGGALLIRFSNGILVSGSILEIEAPEKIVFTYGYESGKPIAPGGSRVTIRLEEHPQGTLLTLLHEFSDSSVRDEHIQGWRYQLALFSNAASDDQHADVEKKVDAYFELWNRKDSAERLARMSGLLVSEISFKDKHSCTMGWEDLNEHLGAYQRFMPGMTLQRSGNVKQCQGTAICGWVATKEDGTVVAKGSNVFALAPDGQIFGVTGFWE